MLPPEELHKISMRIGQEILNSIQDGGGKPSDCLTLVEILTYGIIKTVVPPSEHSRILDLMYRRIVGIDDNLVNLEVQGSA